MRVLEILRLSNLLERSLSAAFSGFLATGEAGTVDEAVMLKTIP